MKKIALISFVLILFASCGTNKAAMNSKKDDKMLNAQWLLQDEEGKTVTDANDKPVSLEFQAEDGSRVSGYAGCNVYGGSFTANGDLMKFSAIFSSKKYCPDMSTEKSFFDLLNNVNRYEIKGNNLYLYKDKLLLLTFKK